MDYNSSLSVQYSLEHVRLLKYGFLCIWDGVSRTNKMNK